MYKTLLISLVNWDSLIEIPAVLANGGCSVDIFCPKESWVLQNSFYDHWIEAPEEKSAFVDKLLDHIREHSTQYNWIIPGDDVIIRLLNDRITDEELFYKIMPLTKIENRALLGSKAGFSNLCRQYHIKTPGYVIYEDGLTTKDIINKVGLPALIKIDKSEGGYGVFLCSTEQDIIENLQRITDKNNLVIQQMIRGYDVNAEVLYKNGVLMVYNYSRTTKVMGQFGVSTQRLFYQNTSIEDILIKAGETLGLNGFGNVVFMYDETKNEHYLIEIDMRPNAWMYYGKFTGNDFSEAIKRVIKNDLTLIKPDTKYINQQVTISLYKKDVYRCIINKDISGLLKWIMNSNNNYRYIPNYDKQLKKACNRYLKNELLDLVKNKLRSLMGKNDNE